VIVAACENCRLQIGELNAQAQSPFAQSSAASAGDEGARNVNWGNVGLADIALVLLYGGGGFVVWNERKRLSIAQPSGWDKLINTRPELGELLPLLAKADAQTVQVITRTLSERGK
jgi:hypothetical protein